MFLEPPTLRSGVCSSGEEEEEKSCFAHSSKSHGWHAPHKTTLPVEEITTYNAVMIMPVRMCTHVHGFLKNTYSVAATFDYRLKSSLDPRTHSRLVAAGFPGACRKCVCHIHDVIVLEFRPQWFHPMWVKPQVCP